VECWQDAQRRPVLTITAPPDAPSVEIDLRPWADAEDPLLYLHVADTMNNQLAVLLFVVNDPRAPRFDTDRLPDGTKTLFGTHARNLPAEVAAMQAGLAPGQVRRGLRVLGEALASFEQFVAQLGRDLYLVEPLAYHMAVILERRGFKYQQGRRWMESINRRFAPGGDLLARLDGSTPFRRPGAEATVRGRSWAIHDGILGEPYTGVRMYRRVGVPPEADAVLTFPQGDW
jgi:acetoin utilization protein AcuC